MSSEGRPAAPGQGAPLAGVAPGDDLRFNRIVLWSFLSLFPLTAMFVIMAGVSGSNAVVVYAVIYGISIAVQAFALYAMRQVLRRNPYRFPYGAGKLENFGAFLSGVLYVPSGLYMAYGACLRLLHPGAVAYALAMLPVAIEALRTLALYAITRRLARRELEPPPLVLAYVIGFRVGVLTDGGVLLAFAAGLLLVRMGLAEPGERVDPLVALCVSGYMVWAGTFLVRRNFRALMDLPLPEAEQMRVMKVLAAHYADYEGIGTLYSRSSGKRRFVEIELTFPGTRTLAEITALAARMEGALTTELPELTFRVIPVSSEAPESAAF
jgi:ferrous-iron efflux pump FieF